MKKKILAAVLTGILCLTGINSIAVLADSQKVITLGADLTQEQRDAMLRYFNVDTSTARILTITNEDERDLLGSYVPLEQIGTFTVSSAYVKPTTQGGIRVRTANLNFVTSNMIATTLSTSGVVNCDVIAASPFEVSGTGALTGIMMAYETASGEKLDEQKKDLAAKELVVTGNFAQDVGRNDATTVVNEAKMQVIENNVQQVQEIQNIVVNVVQENNLTVNQDRLDEIVDLLEGISQQDYQYEEMKETLERVDENVNSLVNDKANEEQGAENPDESIVTETPAPEDSENTDGSEPEAETPEDDILTSVDESALGDHVISDSTEEPAQEDDWGEGMEEADGDWDVFPAEGTDASDEGADPEPDNSTQIDGNIPMEEMTPDHSQEEGDPAVAEANPEEGTDPSAEEPSEENEADVMTLSEEDQAHYDDLNLFCQAVYQGDMEVRENLTASGKLAQTEDPSAETLLAPETAQKLTEKVLDAYKEVLSPETVYMPQEDDKYLTPQANMMDQKLKELFSVAVAETVQTDAGQEDFLAELTQEQKQALYFETMKFIENIYGEASTPEAPADETVQEAEIPEGALSEGTAE